MNRQRLDQFRSRFGIKSDEDAFIRFRTRVLHASKVSISSLDPRERLQLEREFAFLNGSEITVEETLYGSPFVTHGIVAELGGAKFFTQLIERTQHLLWAFESLGFFAEKNRYSEGEFAGLTFERELSRAIEMSPGVDVRLQRMADRADIVPAGIEIMDDAVDSVTQWLSQYPDVQKEFRLAQTILAEKKREQYRQAQDSLRYALEKLLKLLLQNNVSLEKQGKCLKEWLARRGITEGLRNVVVQIMGLLVKEYQNAVVKHDNAVAEGNVKGWGDHEVEYLLYQHAALLRLLLEASEHATTT